MSCVNSLFNRFATIGLVIACVIPLPASSQSDAPAKPDQPLLIPFPDATVRKTKVDDFGEFKAALGPGYQATGSSVALRKSQSFEGKHTITQYEAPAGKSELEIIRTYEHQLTVLGFKKLYACGNDACGANFTQQVYATDENLNPMLATFGFHFHYTAWQGTKDGTGFTVVICAVSPPSQAAPATFQVDIIEAKATARNSFPQIDQVASLKSMTQSQAVTL